MNYLKCLPARRARSLLLLHRLIKPIPRGIRSQSVREKPRREELVWLHFTILLLVAASSVSAQSISFRQTISLQSYHDRFLVAEEDGRLNADRQDPQAWERFQLIDPIDQASTAAAHFGDRVALRSAHGTWVTAAPGGSADALPVLGQSGEWTIVDPYQVGATGPVKVRQRVALLSTHGTYLVAEQDGRANANRTDLGDWETWRIGLEWTDFYYDEAIACGPGECCPCPYRGRFDGANCFVARPPTGRKPRLENGEFYYEADSGSCPLGTPAGTSCRIGSNPVAPSPFLWDGGFYLDSMCSPGGELRPRVERVAHCTPPLCRYTLTRDEFGPWPENHVPRGIQRQTMIGSVFGPVRQATKRVALILAGQQFRDGSGNLLTGQPDAFKEGWTLREPGREFVLDARSLAQRLLEEGILDPQSSLLAVAFDARFNHKFNSANKDRIENAYYQWLLDRFDPENLELLYLAGFSRGGCLALRLAKRFQSEMPDLPVVAQSFDAVCNRNQRELGITIPGRVDNPLSSDNKVYAWPTDLRKQFENTTNSLAVLHHVGGHRFLNPGIWVRALSQQNADKPELDLCWFRQQWFDRGHGSFGGLASVQPALDHLGESLDRFANGPQCPQSGRCAKKELVPLPFECNDLFPADCEDQSECRSQTTCRHVSGSLTCNDLQSEAECDRYTDWCRWRNGQCRKRIFVPLPFECNDLLAGDCGNHDECRLEEECRKRSGAGALTCSDLFSEEVCERYDRWCDWRQ